MSTASTEKALGALTLLIIVISLGPPQWDHNWTAAGSNHNPKCRLPLQSMLQAAYFASEVKDTVPPEVNSEEVDDEQKSSQQVASLYKDEGYELVWSDEFNKPGKPDAKKWTYEVGFRRNDELQWYQSDNARCENGILIIEARREHRKNPHYVPGSSDWRRARESAEYTSANLITRGLHQWQYGRFEMRGRIDTRPGIWPAWWMLGVQGRWPANGEIDIMEYYREMLLANVAWAQEPTPDEGRVRWDDVKIPLQDMGGANWSKQFHVWRMDWDEKEIVLSVDGKVLNRTDLKDALNPSRYRPRQPFHQPHYMLVNLAIGGTQGGDPSETAFPARYEVDYIRVYQKN